MARTDKRDCLFVYGTLMRGCGGPMHGVLQREADFYREGRFQGILYDVGGYPGAVPSDDEQDVVRGEIYRVKDTARLFKILDEYEGWTSEGEDLALFRRERVKASIRGGEEVEVWIYLYNRSVKKKKRILSGNYRTYLERRE